MVKLENHNRSSKADVIDWSHNICSLTKWDDWQQQWQTAFAFLEDTLLSTIGLIIKLWPEFQINYILKNVWFYIAFLW